jgi:hypothetical protein
VGTDFAVKMMHEDKETAHHPARVGTGFAAKMMRENKKTEHHPAEVPSAVLQ